MIRNIASDKVKRIPAKRMGDTSSRAFLTIENVVPQTDVRMMRMIIARVFLDNATELNKPIFELVKILPHFSPSNMMQMRRLMEFIYEENGLL